MSILGQDASWHMHKIILLKVESSLIYPYMRRGQVETLPKSSYRFFMTIWDTGCLLRFPMVYTLILWMDSHFNLKNDRLSAILWIVWNEDEEPYTIQYQKKLELDYAILRAWLKICDFEYGNHHSGKGMTPAWLKLASRLLGISKSQGEAETAYWQLCPSCSRQNF